MSNRQIIVQTLPTGPLGPEHFSLQEVERPTPKPGEVLLRTILMSIDAANRSWMQGATYREAVKAGDVMATYAISEVIESTTDRFSPGDIVASENRWADYVVWPAHK